MMGVKRCGGFAQYVCLPSAVVRPLPENLSFHEAAGVMRHAPTAWNLLVNIAKLQKDEWVLIMGASGNLGAIGIQIAKNVIGARADLGLDPGADVAVDYSSQSILVEIMKATGSKGVNVLYDNTANPKVLPQAFKGIGMDGRLVTAGAHGGPDVPIDFFHLYDHRITIKGSPGSREGDLPACFAAAANGRIKVQIAKSLPLSQAAEAHFLVENDPGMGKIVLDPTLD